jgi:DNA ligase 1
MSDLINLPTLYKRTANGGVQSWQIAVHQEDDGSAVILTTHGLVDGKKQTARDVVREGKNAGKKNATTPTQQAIAEATSSHTKKQERDHYGLTPEESDLKKLVAPMLAHKYEDHGSKVEWHNNGQPKFVQPKFDGHRCLAFCTEHGINLLSRKAVGITSCPHIVDSLARVMQPGETFDGELYIHNLALNKIASRITKQQEGSQDLRYMVYDMLDPGSSFSTRILTVEKKIEKIRGEAVDLSRTQTVTDLDDAMEFQREAIENGYEGAMLRWGKTGYQPGKRSVNLLKMKTFVDGEFTIIDSKTGRGAFEGMAVFICVTEDGHPFDVTAPGTHEEKQKAWANRDSYLGKRLTVKYQKFTDTDKPVPFLPVAKGFAE